jgi:hypothetical protein
MGALKHKYIVQTMVYDKTISACEAQMSASLSEFLAMGESRKD